MPNVCHPPELLACFKQCPAARVLTKIGLYQKVSLPEAPCSESNGGEYNQGVSTMSRVTIKTGFMDADGREEELTEYLCDHPNCPNIATRVFGCRELGLMAAVCEVHAVKARA
jgi:hypothetical protein